MATRPWSAILYSKDERFLSERNTHMLRLKGYNCITALFLLAAEGRQLYVTTFNTSEGSHVLVY